ncbi:MULTISPECIES: tripartite tricarboxylate transporter permease [Oceanisphaera]|uniref:Tripartite tricarboxylate transporter permease n=1 Tax=Oceanisphaera ostreae TaxID=914151 RepID=A0ABW3KLQ5_9GAMM
MLDALSIGLLTASQPSMLLAAFVGVTIGVFIGMLPGLTSTMGVALLIPVTFSFPPAVGLALLGGIYLASTFSGSISAILLNIPGTPSAVATCQDGYPMTRNGQAGRAVGLSVFASCIGGIFSAIVLLFMAPMLSEFSLMLGAPEYFLLALFGVTIIASLSEGSMLKSMIGGVLGLIISLIGMHSLTGEMRLTLGQPSLYDGIPLVITLIGLYSIPEVVNILSEKTSSQKRENSQFTGALSALKGVLAQRLNVLRSSVIGTVIGIIPGAGQSIASFIAYDAAKRSSRTPEQFGKGSEEGLVAAETANNAVTGGSLVPLLTLGVPGNAVSAVLMGGLIIHGLTPGPILFDNSPDIAYGFIFSLLFSNLMFVPIGLLVAKYCVKVILLPKEILAASILTLAVIGSYAIRGQVSDIGLMLGIGVIGYLFMFFSVSRAPMVLGLVLGTMAESNLSRALTLVRGDVGELLVQFITRPFSLVLVVLCLASIIMGYLKSRRASQDGQETA